MEPIGHPALQVLKLGREERGPWRTAREGSGPGQKRAGRSCLRRTFERGALLTRVPRSAWGPQVAWGTRLPETDRGPGHCDPRGAPQRRPGTAVSPALYCPPLLSQGGGPRSPCTPNSVSTSAHRSPPLAGGQHCGLRVLRAAHARWEPGLGGRGEGAARPCAPWWTLQEPQLRERAARSSTRHHPALCTTGKPRPGEGRPRQQRPQASSRRRGCPSVPSAAPVDLVGAVVLA